MKGDFADELKKKRKAQRDKAAADKARKEQLDNVSTSSSKVADAVSGGTQALLDHEPRVEVKNRDLAKTKDVQSVVDSINSLNLTTFIANKDTWVDVVGSLGTLADRMKGLVGDLKTNGADKMEKTFTEAATKLDQAVSSIKTIKVESDQDVAGAVAKLSDTLSSIDWKPVVKVPAPKVSVESGTVDLKPLRSVLEGLQGGIDRLAETQPQINLDSVAEGLGDVETAVRDLIAKPIPVPETPLPFRNQANEGVQIQLDANGKLPVAGTLSGGGDGAILDGDSGSIKATVLDYANSNPLAVRLTDAGGDYVAAGAGTQYTEDAAAAADPVGGMLIGRRKDTLSGSQVSTDGDNIALNATAKGELYVKQTDAVPVTDNGGSLTVDGTVGVSGTVTVDSELPAGLTATGTALDVNIASGASSGTEYTEDAAAPANPVGGIVQLRRKDTLSGSEVSGDGDVITANATAKGELYVKQTDAVPVTDNGSTLSVDDGAGSLTVDGTVAVTNSDITTLAGAIKNEDVASANADPGMVVHAKRAGTPGNTSGTDGDYEPLQVAAGRLWTSSTIDAALPAGTNAIGKLAANDGVDIGDVTTTNFPATVDSNSGNKSASTLRVVLATDQPALSNKLLVTPDLPTGASTLAEQQTQTTALQLIDDIVYTDDTSTHATGTSKGALVMAAAAPTDGSVNANDIGAVAMTTDRKLHVSVQDAIPAGNNNIGDVDIASIAAGNNNIGDVDVATLPVAFNSGTTSATTQRVVLATDVALPAGTNAIGKLAANSGVDIGDVDITSVVTGTGATNLGKAEDGGHTTGDVGVMALGVRNDTPRTAISGTDLDYTPITTTSTGAIRNAPMSEDFAALANGPQVKKYYTNAGAVTDGIIWSPASGTRWYVTDLIINVSAAATVTLEDDKAGGDEVVMKFELAANSGVQHSFLTPLFSGEDAADLMVTTSAGNVYITVVGYEI